MTNLSIDSKVIRLLAVTGHDYKKELVQLAQNEAELDDVYNTYEQYKGRFGAEFNRIALRDLINAKLR